MFSLNFGFQERIVEGGNVRNSKQSAYKNLQGIPNSGPKFISPKNFKDLKNLLNDCLAWNLNKNHDNF